jgi:hypothetical protein
MGKERGAKEMRPEKIKANLNISKIHFNMYSLNDVIDEIEGINWKLKGIQHEVRNEMFKLQNYISGIELKAFDGEKEEM